MKTLKKILLFILLLIVALLVVGLFTKKDYVITKEVTINKPKQQVFDYLKLLKNQNEFSKWAKMDPNMKKDFKGTDGTVGFISMWEGTDDVGKGEQEITAIKEGEKIETEIRFIEPFESKAKGIMAVTAVDSASTKVSWSFDTHMNFPMNLFGLVMGMESSIGDDLQVGLNNLKTLLEK